MKTFKITFANGDTITTSMNATLSEAAAYYIGNHFQFGDTDEKPYDDLIEAVKVEEVNEPLHFEFIARGRNKGAIGVMHNLYATFDANSFKDFKRQVYDRFEHIQQPTVTCNGATIDFWDDNIE